MLLSGRSWFISFTKAQLFEVCLKAGLLEVGVVQPLLAFDNFKKARAARRIVTFVSRLRKRGRAIVDGNSTSTAGSSSAAVAAAAAASSSSSHNASSGWPSASAVLKKAPSAASTTTLNSTAGLATLSSVIPPLHLAPAQPPHLVNSPTSRRHRSWCSIKLVSYLAVTVFLIALAVVVFTDSPVTVLAGGSVLVLVVLLAVWFIARLAMYDTL
jgi:hypothetical protein